MPQIYSGLSLLSIEICFLVLILITVLFDLIFKSEKLIISISLGSLLFIGILFLMNTIEGSKIFFFNQFQQSNFIHKIQLLIIVSAILATIFSWFTFTSSKKEQINSSFYYLLNLLVFFLLFLVKSTHLISFILTLEAVSLMSYILIGMFQNKFSTEASIKYLLFGAISTSVMLFGFSILYTQGFDLSFIKSNNPFQLNILTIVAIFMSFAGLLFKLSLFPFHFWSPDVYQGTPTPLIAFFSTASKFAVLPVFVLLIDIYNFSPEMTKYLTWGIGMIAFVTMLFSSVIALAQEDVKRMMAWSALSHTGFFISMLLVDSDLSNFALVYYLIVYTLMTFMIFVLLEQLQLQVNSWNIKDFIGLGSKMIILALFTLLALLALIGLPPTAGFTAKLFVFTSLWQAYASNSNALYLIILVGGMINTVISLFYYFKIPYYLFVKKSENDLILTSPKWYVYIFLILLSFPIVILFLNPELVSIN